MQTILNLLVLKTTRVMAGLRRRWGGNFQKKTRVLFNQQDRVAHVLANSRCKSGFDGACSARRTGSLGDSPGYPH
jgi:hypothetical protein